MQGRSGYFRAGAIARIPIFLHWSLPIGLFVFSGFRFEPHTFFGILTIILVHELGHAFVAKVRGCPVQSIEMNALGGLCRAQIRTEVDGIVIAWGGVLAQAWLYLLAAGYFLVRPADSQGSALLEHVLVETNLVIAAFNLIPFPPFDGAQAWRIVSVLGVFRRKNAVAPLSARDDPRAASPAPSRTRKAAESTRDEDEIALTVKEALARARDESRPPR